MCVSRLENLTSAGVKKINKTTKKHRRKSTKHMRRFLPVFVQTMKAASLQTGPHPAVAFLNTVLWVKVCWRLIEKSDERHISVSSD